MFKKLRNRLLLWNLIVISLIMVLSFVSIYLITYKNVRNEIDLNLRIILDDKRFDRSIPNFDFSQLEPANNRPPPPPPPLRSVYFSFIIDRQWNINTSTISSIFNTDTTFFESAKKEVLSQNKNSGVFIMDGTYWAFITRPVQDGYKIAFLDTSFQQGVLMNLIYTFIIVALIMLVFIFLISRFFADNSIKPVKEAFDKQKQFIADASHELKTPLAVVNTNIDVILSNGEDTINSQSKWINYIKSEAERMTNLTNALLYLTQVDHSEIKMIYSDFNMSETVENVILTMEAVVFEHDLLLNYEMEPNLVARGNSDEIRQVVMILLDNALKYTNNKGTIEISLKKQHNVILLSLSNTGEGIAEDHLEKVFDRFYRTDKSRTRKHGGYGLGLSIAKAIITQHSGKIYVKSIINEKTTFYVELPLVKE